MTVLTHLIVLLMRLGYVFWGKRPQWSSATPITSSQGAIEVLVTLDHLSEVVFVGFLSCKVIPHPLLYCALWRKATSPRPQLRSGGGLCATSLRAKHLHKLQLVSMGNLSVLSHLFTYMIFMRISMHSLQIFVNHLSFGAGSELSPLSLRTALPVAIFSSLSCSSPLAFSPPL